MIWLLVVGVAAEVVFVVEVCRHGARSPTTYFSWDYDGRWPQGQGELTPLGMRQHFLIGAEMMNRYIVQEPLLSQNYNSSEIFVYSTDYNRTLQSAYSQLQGLYPEGTGPSISNSSVATSAVPPIRVDNLTEIQADLGLSALPSLMQSVPVHTDDNSRNLLLLPDDNCPYISNILYHSNVNENAKSQIYAMYPSVISTIESYFNIGYNAATSQVSGLYDSLTANQFSGFAIPAAFDTDSFLNQMDSMHAQLFSLEYGQPPIVPQALATPFMSLLNESLTYASNNSTGLKFLLLSAHDSTLQGYINGLQLNTTQAPVYASTLIIELHLVQGSYFVALKFNDSVVVVPACPEAFCPLETFLSYLNSRIIPNIEGFCNNSTSAAHATVIEKRFERLRARLEEV